MSVRNNAVIALAIVTLAGQGCFDIGPLNIPVFGPDECCSSGGGGGYYAPVLQRLYFGRPDSISADSISADTIVTGGIDTLRLYPISNYGSLYRPAGLQITVGDSNVATVQVSDSILPIPLTIRALAPGVTTLTATAEGHSVTDTLVVTGTTVAPVRAVAPQAGPRRDAGPPTTRTARIPTRR